MCIQMLKYIISTYHIALYCKVHKSDPIIIWLFVQTVHSCKIFQVLIFISLFIKITHYNLYFIWAYPV